jgi:acyl-CoA dehydrogenase
MLNVSNRPIFTEDHNVFRDQVRKFLAARMVPQLDRWEANGVVDREFWLEFGAQGLLCPTVDEAYGGLGLDFLYNVVISEEIGYLGSTAGMTLQSDVVVAYIERYGSEEQKLAYLPKMISGELIVAIAMTEPSTGSDLASIKATARRDGGDFVVNGSKTYITNGQLADAVIVAVKTDTEKGAKGISLIFVEADRPGFARGRNLDKIGNHSADTSELFFSDVHVPITNCIGEEGAGFRYLMGQLAQERMAIAVGGQAVAQRALDEAISFTKERKAFGKTVFEFQNTRFALADLATKIQVGWAHLDWALSQLLSGQLTGAQAAAAKLWHTELQWDAVDTALQLHGGAGYMSEYPISRLWRDARVTRIYGGTSEIMKEVIGRQL